MRELLNNLRRDLGIPDTDEDEDGLGLTTTRTLTSDTTPMVTAHTATENHTGNARSTRRRLADDGHSFKPNLPHLRSAQGRPPLPRPGSRGSRSRPGSACSNLQEVKEEIEDVSPSWDQHILSRRVSEDNEDLSSDAQPWSSVTPDILTVEHDDAEVTPIQNMEIQSAGRTFLTNEEGDSVEEDGSQHGVELDGSLEEVEQSPVEDEPDREKNEMIQESEPEQDQEPVGMHQDQEDWQDMAGNESKEEEEQEDGEEEEEEEELETRITTVNGEQYPEDREEDERTLEDERWDFNKGYDERQNGSYRNSEEKYSEGEEGQEDGESEEEHENYEEEEEEEHENQLKAYESTLGAHQGREYLEEDDDQEENEDSESMYSPQPMGKTIRPKPQPRRAKGDLSTPRTEGTPRSAYTSESIEVSELDTEEANDF